MSKKASRKTVVISFLKSIALQRSISQRTQFVNQIIRRGFGATLPGTETVSKIILTLLRESVLFPANHSSATAFSTKRSCLSIIFTVFCEAVFLTTKLLEKTLQDSKTVVFLNNRPYLAHFLSELCSFLIQIAIAKFLITGALSKLFIRE